MIIDKKMVFLIKMAKNLASIEDEEERLNIVMNVAEEERNLLLATIKALRSAA